MRPNGSMLTPGDVVDLQPGTPAGSETGGAVPTRALRSHDSEPAAHRPGGPVVLDEVRETLELLLDLQRQRASRNHVASTGGQTA